MRIVGKVSMVVMILAMWFWKENSLGLKKISSTTLSKNFSLLVIMLIQLDVSTSQFLQRFLCQNPFTQGSNRLIFFNVQVF